MERQALLDRARHRGVNPLVYWLVRALLQPFFHAWFRLSRLGREHVPQDGPVIFAANHRSFLDPFLIGCLVRRPMYFVAKRELFEASRLQAWVLNALGAFPIDRGASDGEAMATARVILERGDCVCIFPEGTRVRPGGLGRPKRGVGRLALETGAPVVPVAVLGTEAIRRGWRIRPHKVRVRAGRPLTFPRVERPSPQLAGAVTDRIWPMVALQWEWLGGAAPIRRAAVVGPFGADLARGMADRGVDVVHAARAADADLAERDLVVLALPARELPATLAAHGGRIPAGAAVLVATRGLVPPLGTLPSAFVAERVPSARVAVFGGTLRAPVVGTRDRDLGALLRAVLGDAEVTGDVAGVELAGVAKEAAAAAGPERAGRVFAEVDALAAHLGARRETMVGPAGVGALLADPEPGPEAHDALALLANAVEELAPAPHGRRAA